MLLFTTFYFKNKWKHAIYEHALKPLPAQLEPCFQHLLK